MPPFLFLSVVANDISLAGLRVLGVPVSGYATDLLIGAVLGMAYAPYGLIYRWLVRPRLGPPGELVVGAEVGGRERRALARAREDELRDLGGLLLEHFSWGAVFLVNVPLCAAAVGTVRSRTSRISQVVTLIAVIVPPLGILSAIGGFGLAGFKRSEKGFRLATEMIGSSSR